MSCKQSELVAAINSFTAAVVSNDPNLKAFSSKLLGSVLQTIEYDPEDPEVTETKEDTDASEEAAVTPEVV